MEQGSKGNRAHQRSKMHRISITLYYIALSCVDEFTIEVLSAIETNNKLGQLSSLLTVDIQDDSKDSDFKDINVASIVTRLLKKNYTSYIVENGTAAINVSTGDCKLCM